MGKEQRRWGAYRQRIEAENGHLKVFVVSNGSIVSVVVVVLCRMTNGGRRRCNVERMILGTDYILPGWCTADNHGMGPVGGSCDSMARYSPEEPKRMPWELTLMAAITSCAGEATRPTGVEARSRLQLLATTKKENEL
jgi:hypothetical protein